jgi:excisionase family DNA binding protein
VSPAYNTADDLPHKGFLNTREAAALLGVSERTIRKYIKLGRFGALRRTWLYGNTTGRNRRSAYFIPVAEMKRYLLGKVVEKYARPHKWLPPDDNPDAIMESGK